MLLQQFQFRRKISAVIHPQSQGQLTLTDSTVIKVVKLTVFILMRPRSLAGSPRSSLLLKINLTCPSYDRGQEPKNIKVKCSVFMSGSCWVEQSWSLWFYPVHFELADQHLCDTAEKTFSHSLCSKKGKDIPYIRLQNKTQRVQYIHMIDRFTQAFYRKGAVLLRTCPKCWNIKNTNCQ